MNWLDVVLGIILLASMLHGLRRGFSRQIIGLVTVVLALLLGSWFYGTPAHWFSTFLNSPALAGAMGFAAVFCSVMLVGALASMLVRRFLKVTGLSFFDHVLGAAFGLLRGALVAIAIVMGTMAFARTGSPPRAVVESRLAPYVVDAARFFASLAPHDLKEGFRKTYAQVKAAWHDTIEKGIRSMPAGEKKKDERQI